MREYGHDPEMVLINQAVTRHDGEVRFYNCDNGVSTTSPAHMAHWQDRISDWREEVVPCIAINTLLSRHAARTDFLNIDVEGTNLDLLRAIEPRYLRGMQMICIEHDGHEQEMLERLADAGFSAIHHNDENLIFVRGSRWRSRNLRRSAQALTGRIEVESLRPPAAGAVPQPG